MTEIIPPTSSWNKPPTFKQVRAIANLARILGYHDPVEHKPSNRLEARDMIMGFRTELRKRRTNAGT